MGTPSKGVVVIRVARNEEGRWNILESDFDDPIAGFDDRQSACDYANNLGANRDETIVVLLDDRAQRDQDSKDGNGIYPAL